MTNSRGKQTLLRMLTQLICRERFLQPHLVLLWGYVAQFVIFLEILNASIRFQNKLLKMSFLVELSRLSATNSIGIVVSPDAGFGKHA